MQKDMIELKIDPSSSLCMQTNNGRSTHLASYWDIYVVVYNYYECSQSPLPSFAFHDLVFYSMVSNMEPNE